MQHGEFLSEHFLLGLSLQFSSQHASVSSEPKSPASHSSSPSTLKLPQKLSSGSVKHLDDLANSTWIYKILSKKSMFFNYEIRPKICSVFQNVWSLDMTWKFFYNQWWFGSLCLRIFPITSLTFLMNRRLQGENFLLLTSYPDTE